MAVVIVMSHFVIEFVNNGDPQRSIPDLYVAVIATVTLLRFNFFSFFFEILFAAQNTFPTNQRSASARRRPRPMLQINESNSRSQICH